MSNATDLLFTHVWWTYDPPVEWPRELYHWFNLIEGAVWLGIAVFVIRRFHRHRRTSLELLYGAAFVTFGLSDFREAYRLESWLVLLKAANLLALWLLRRCVLRSYPESRSF